MGVDEKALNCLAEVNCLLVTWRRDLNIKFDKEKLVKAEECAVSWRVVMVSSLIFQPIAHRRGVWLGFEKVWVARACLYDACISNSSMANLQTVEMHNAIAN